MPKGHPIPIDKMRELIRAEAESYAEFWVSEFHEPFEAKDRRNKEMLNNWRLAVRHSGLYARLHSNTKLHDDLFKHWLKILVDESNAQVYKQLGTTPEELDEEDPEASIPPWERTGAKVKGLL